MKDGKTQDRLTAMLEGVARYEKMTGGKRSPMDYPEPYPYWLRGKVNRIRR